MFSLKKMIFAGIGAFVIIGAIVGVSMYMRSGGQEVLPNEETGVQEGEPTVTLPSYDQGNDNPPEQVPQGVEQPVVTQPPLVKNQEELEIEQRAINFAERFGSYSSQSNYAHAYAVMPLASVRMQKWLTEMISQNAVDDISGVAFKGVMTRALGSRLSRGSEAGKASVEVDTQRIETSDTEGQKIVMQPIRIELVKEGERWVVDGAFWGDVK